MMKQLTVYEFLSTILKTTIEQNFTKENSIAVLQICRDEIVHSLKSCVDSIYGSSFNLASLGCILTCGVTGLKACLSHCPIIDGKRKILFFIFPHIATNNIKRYKIDEDSIACGALYKYFDDFIKNKKYNIIESSDLNKIGSHDPNDIEFSILSQRLSRFIQHHQTNLDELDLMKITELVRIMTTQNLIELIDKCLDKNDHYIIFSGIQIHSGQTDSNKVSTEDKFIINQIITSNESNLDKDI